MPKKIQKEWQAKVAIIGFILFTLWWLYNNLIVGNQNIRYDSFLDFGGLYGFIAVWGAIWGLVIAQQWGGLKSVIGKALILFSLGLLAQEFGQLYYALYNDIYKTPGPYPSLGDAGFFGSIPLYIGGVLLLAQAAGVKVRLGSFTHKLQALFIPVVMLVVSYFIFLQGYTFDLSNPVKVFLDFGYPFGQAIYISLAILTYVLSKGLLGGIMKSRILFLLLALCIQFLSDFTFLYQSSKGVYHVGEIVDYTYLLSYFVMTLALLQFKTVLRELKK